MVLYLIREAEFKVRLNKYLFYSDFLNYKTTGYSISGYDYQAIQLGPVPDQYGTKFDILKQMKYIDEESVLYRDNYFEKFIPLKGFDKSLFTEQEIASLDMVIKKMTNKSQKEIVDMSHQELGWIENQKLHSIISYQKYAFLLKNI